ncbi:MAG: PEP/pyruvate-binding domain-containing protein, partial [Candidatus Nezhaarchaeales archaeon]
MRNKAYVLWFEEIDKNDLPLVGGKSANLGELTKAGIPVPPGFAVTSYAYREFIEKTGLRE